MSKRLITGLLVASLAVLSFGCDEDNGNTRPKKPTTGDECSSDTWSDACKNESTLLKCEGGKVVSQDCGEGNKCQKGECVAKPAPTVTCKVSESKPACTKDGHLQTCVDGILQTQDCAFGCENGACITACTWTDKRCNNSNTAVTECKDGIIEVVEECPCSLGKCKKTCTDKGTSKCNGNTLVSCDSDGFENEVACANGCADGKCEERCQEGCVGKKLVKCNEGMEDSVTTCEYGCKDLKCLTKEEAGGGDPPDPGSQGGTGDSGGGGGVVTVPCADDPVRCSLKNELIVCDENGQKTVTPCEFGCADNKCKDASTAPACNDTSDHCDTFGLNVLRCVNGKQAQIGCEFGCTNGKCNDEANAINCTEGATECENGGQMIMECKNNKLEFKGCEYGCTDGKCNDKPAEKDSCKGKGDTCSFSGGKWKMRKCVNEFYEDEICEGKCAFNAFGKGEIQCVPSTYCTVDMECKNNTTCDTEQFKCI